MVMVIDLIQLTLKDLWKEVKDEEEWWGEIDERISNVVKLILYRRQSGNRTRGGIAGQLV